jgi:hypothetical protein
MRYKFVVEVMVETSNSEEMFTIDNLVSAVNKTGHKAEVYEDIDMGAVIGMYIKLKKNHLTPVSD